MAIGDTFYNLCRRENIGRMVENPENGKLYFEISIEDFQKLNELNILFDGTKGGLVIGKLHIDGGVHFIRPNHKTGHFEYGGEMEGWEYLSSPVLSNDFGEKLVTLNNSIKGKLTYENTEFKIPKRCKVIDTYNLDVAVIVLSNVRHFVVNRFATRKHIKKIIKLEEKTNR